MTLANGPDRFGQVTRALHWVTALLVLALLALGLRLATMTPSLDTLWLYGLHKSLGLSAALITLARFAWHRISPPPPPLTEGIPIWQRRAARATHAALYACLILMPLAGWIGSDATGIGTLFWGWPLPPLVTPSEALETAAFTAHGLLGLLLGALVALHAGAALHRHFVHREATLRRMLWPSGENDAKGSDRG